MAPTLRAEGLAFSPELVDQFMFGLVLVGAEGRVDYLNHKARQLLLPPESDIAGSWSCCDLICSRLGPVLDGACLSRRAVEAGGSLPEVRMDIESERLETAAWVTVSPLRPGDPQLLFHLRPGKTGDRRRRIAADWTPQARSREGSELRVSTLGKIEIEAARGPLDSGWLEQKPGQLLKYLLCQRRRVVTNDQLAEALWPGAGIEEGQGRLRYNVHQLRERLEPDRPSRSPSRFVVSRRGGYMFDTGHVWVDVDEFEREARAGLAAFERTRHEQAGEHLANALRLYKGDFLADDPYAEWAMEEQERLRSLAAQGLRTLARINIELGRLGPAAEQTRRLSDLEPFDADVQQLMIEICLRRGRRSEAHRRYAHFKRRMASVFGAEPEFDLLEVERRVTPAGSRV